MPRICLQSKYKERATSTQLLFVTPDNKTTTSPIDGGLPRSRKPFENTPEQKAQNLAQPTHANTRLLRYTHAQACQGLGKEVEAVKDE